MCSPSPVPSCGTILYSCLALPAPAKSTASIELASVAEGATAVELEALGHSAGGVGSERGAGTEADMPMCERALDATTVPRDAAGRACGFDELGRRGSGNDRQRGSTNRICPIGYSI